MYRKLLIWALSALVLAGAGGCKLKINRLEKRIERWQSMQGRDIDPEKKYRFARESAIFFLTNDEFQRPREAVVSDQDRLNYHRKLAQMQIYIIEYHAGRALAAISGDSPDWELGRAEWARADTLTLGRLPGFTTTYRLVHIQSGYQAYLTEIALQPGRYERLERDFGGLMSAFRLMSEFKLREAENFMSQGYYDLAIDNYLLVFCRDPEHFERADQAVKRLTGKTVRETYEYQAWLQRAVASFDSDRMELYTNVQGQIAQMAKEVGEDSARANEAGFAVAFAERYKITPEQAVDIYYYSKTGIDGTLPAYLLQWAPEVLRGQKALRLPPAN
ncbi:MAG: hypothetical protein V1794_17445 [Candidatus Glassbacteria bacterium]